jgi:hypothetical protein
MNVSVLTRSYDFARSGVNPQEAVLTADAVRTRGIKKLFTLHTPDDGRGRESSPLVVPGLKLPNGAVHDVVFLPTMGNCVYAYDANDGSLLWKRQLGTPIRGNVAIDQHTINQFWGILSTPVIHDGSLYGCAWISVDGTPARGQHFAFALDLTTGHDAKPLLNLEGTVFEPGHGLNAINFRSAQRKQRSALAISHGALIIPFGTIAETSQTARGWLIAVDLGSWKIAANWCSTARGSGGGIWMAGQGPTVLPNGDLACFTGNGDFDAVTDFGESLCRVRFAPAAGQTAAKFSLVDWWTPWADDGRTGGDPEGEGAAPPSNFRKIVQLARRGALRQGMAAGEWGDMDLGSAGVAYVPSLDLLLGAGKDGVLYAAKATNLGKTKPADLEPAKNQANYAKLAFPPIFFTYYPPDLDPAPPRIETLNVLWNQRTHHQHGAPVSFASPELGPMLFNWGENENGRAWQVTANSCRYLARTAELASPDARLPGGGMPGANLSLSCNGNQANSAVLWACVPYNDANTMLSAGRLIAYAATQFENGFMTKLWDSQDWAHQFTHNKFAPPVVANGKLFVPTYDGATLVYGLA